MFTSSLNEDQRRIFNTISDVIANRPSPLRQFDQIYMKTADMLMQVNYVSPFLDKKTVVFIGDGDAIGLCMIHLHNERLIKSAPTRVHVLDFDERIVDSINAFASAHGFSDRISASLYNVIDRLPIEHWQVYDAFYTNPPFGASNDGYSVRLFAQRGVEATSAKAIGCLVLADDCLPWTQKVLYNTQKYLMDEQFVITSLEPKFHQYHLDDEPGLHSCTMVVTRLNTPSSEYASQDAPKELLKNFYGKGKDVKVQYVLSRGLSEVMEGKVSEV